MKTTTYLSLVLIFIITFLGEAMASHQCSIDYSSYKLSAPVDCEKCQHDLETPADRVEATVNPVVDFLTKSNEHTTTLRKLKVREHFLKSNSNKSECSNFPSILNEFKSDFEKYLSTCEKGPDLLGSRKSICNWVLTTYSSKITESFYDHWRDVGPKGEVVFIPGRKMEDLEAPIRSHELWCRQIKKNYKNKIYLDCGDVTNWVSEFNRVKKINDSMKRDSERKEETAPIEDSRKNLLREGCKYFDKNPATTLTKDIYLECITN